MKRLCNFPSEEGVTKTQKKFKKAQKETKKIQKRKAIQNFCYKVHQKNSEKIFINTHLAKHIKYYYKISRSISVADSQFLLIGRTKDNEYEIN
jgi:hypothetical protein